MSAAATDDDDCDGGFPNMSEVMAGDAEEGSMTDEVGVLKSRRKVLVFRCKLRLGFILRGKMRRRKKVRHSKETNPLCQGDPLAQCHPNPPSYPIPWNKAHLLISTEYFDLMLNKGSDSPFNTQPKVKKRVEKVKREG